jgi:branched-chain amino acid transport system permease protein
MSPAAETPPPLAAPNVERWTALAKASVAAVLLGQVLLALAPFMLDAGAIDRLTVLFIYGILALMWNALAGYAGLVSVGHQAFFGLGAYAAVRLADAGIGPYPSLLLAAVLVALLAVPISSFMLRLRGGEFAIGMWVLAALCHLLVNLDTLVQGETGTSLIALNDVEPTLRRNLGYGFALVSLAAMLLAVWWLMRSPVGTASRALGDDDEAAASLGVRVMSTRRAVYVLAAFGCALAGVAWLASAITFLPRTNFGVQWSVLMLFMVLVGGLRSLAGPVVGALLLFTLQESLGDFGAWYLAGVGALAAIFALFLPQGLVGLWQERRARLATQAAAAAAAPHGVSVSPTVNHTRSISP